jgi:formate dehydrogenase subunit gamma
MTAQSEQTPKVKSQRKRHMGKVWIKVWIMSFIALLVMVTPLVVTWQMVGISTAYAEFKNDANPRANYWRDVREGDKGYSAIKGQGANELIQNGGQNWRQIRNGPVATIGSWALGIAVAVLVLFHLFIGKAKLEQRTGRMVLRWRAYERSLHWFVAILFIILALTGLSLLYGRAVLIPLIGYDGFASYAQLAKLVHDYLSLFFVVGLILMLAMWFRENLLNKVDWEWFKVGGGYVTKHHAPAYKVNGAEKIWFWILFIVGIGLMISGIVMLFPNLGFERGVMQTANIVHAVSALILSAFVLGHIYLGTIGNEGSFEGMYTGEVDEAWAKQHHDLWYEQVMSGEAGEQQESPSAKGEQSAAPG